MNYAGYRGDRGGGGERVKREMGAGERERERERERGRERIPRDTEKETYTIGG